jgi:predicted nucleic acid-binding protein
MNCNSLLLDTNIVLYLLNGEETLIPILEDKQLYLSFITQLELLSFPGIGKSEVRSKK